jgi:hypothetical protein
LTVLPSGTLRNTRSGAMPSSGLPSGGSRQTWSSSSHVRRQPSADSRSWRSRPGRRCQCTSTGCEFL